MEQLTIRQATALDRDFIFEVVNSDAVRAMSFNSHEISYEEHCRWFDNILSSPALFFIGILGGSSAGYVRFEQQRDVDGHILTVAVAESCRSKGIGSRLVSKCCTEAFSCGINKIWAFVKSENLSSIRLFEKCGFERNGNASYKGYDVVGFFKVKEEQECNDI